MTRSPLRLCALAAVSALALVGVAAAPAQAASPDEVYLHTFFESEGQLYSTDPETGVVSPLGGANVAQAITAVDVDSVTKTGFAVDWTTAANLYTVNAVTGAVALSVPITNPDGTPVSYCLGLDYSAGVLTAACDVPSSSNASNVGTIDPATGVFTSKVVMPRVGSIAKNPVTGVLYGFSIPGQQVYTIDLAAGTSAEAGTFEIAGVPDDVVMDLFFSYLGGADFDSDGVLWGVALAVNNQSQLLSGSITTMNWIASVVDAEGNGVYSESLSVGEIVAPVVPVVPAVTPAAVVAAPVLAATGVETAPVLLAAVVALLAGLGLLVARRRSSALAD